MLRPGVFYRGSNLLRYFSRFRFLGDVNSGLPIGDEEDEGRDLVNLKTDDAVLFGMRKDRIVVPIGAELDHLEVFEMDILKLFQTEFLLFVGHFGIVDEGNLDGHSVFGIVRVGLVLQDLGRGGVLEQGIGDEIEIHAAALEAEGMGGTLEIERDIVFVDLVHEELGVLRERLLLRIDIMNTVAFIDR